MNLPLATSGKQQLKMEDPFIQQQRMAKIAVGPNIVVYSPDGIYSVKWVLRILDVYGFFLLLQYMCFFAGLPFEDISNRQGICLVSDFFLLITVVVSLIMMPVGSSTIPEKVSYLANVIAAIFQTVCLVLISISTAVTLQGESFSIPVLINGKVTRVIDMTAFSRGALIVTLLVCFSTWMLSMLNTYIYGKLLYRLLNRINRHGKSAALDHDVLSHLRRGSYLTNYETENGVLVEFPKEVLKDVEQSFV